MKDGSVGIAGRYGEGRSRKEMVTWRRESGILLRNKRRVGEPVKRSGGLSYGEENETW